MFEYDVFLSHATADKPAVETVARRLRDEQGLRVFFDRWALVPGTHWQQALEQALAGSRTCAVFLGPEGLGPWQSEEIRVALGTHHRVRYPRHPSLREPDHDVTSVNYDFAKLLARAEAPS